MQTCIFWHGWCFHCDSIFKQGNTLHKLCNGKRNQNFSFYTLLCFGHVVFKYFFSIPTHHWNSNLVTVVGGKRPFSSKSKKSICCLLKDFFLYTWHTCDKKHTYKKLKQNSGWWCIFLACKMPAEFIGEEDVGVDIRSYLCRIIP